jgi:hypothetical protein
MRFLRRFFIRLSNFATGRRADQRLREEMAEHLALQTEENLRAGMPPAEARRQAALKLGAAQAIREHHNAEQGLPLAENFLLDLRYAFRMLHRSPGFSLIAIATMALGVGATTAIYSVIDATLLHPLPYPHPSELVRIEANLPGVGAHDIGISIPELRDLQNSGIFQYVSLSFFGTNNLTGSAQPASIASKSVSPSYFAVLGVDAQLGRTFDPHDATPGFNPKSSSAMGSGSAHLAPTRTFSARVCALTTMSIMLSASCPPAFATRAKPARSAVPNCGRRRILRRPRPAADARHAFPLRDHRAPSAWSLA